ncbi:MAG TPA: hypothetical protein DIW26_03025 [Ruminococcus sp.]|nr:hypothetical protein [Ruminococcus sp.]
MAQKSKAKVKRRLKFRFSIIFLSFLLSFILCFIAYVNGMKNKIQDTSAKPVMNSNVSDSKDSSADNSSDGIISENSDGSADSNADSSQNADENSSDNQEDSSSDDTSSDENQDSENSDESSAVNADVSNPVAQSDRKDDSYLSDCVFVGDSISTGFSGYGFVSEKNVFAKTSMRIDLINNTPLDTFYGNVLVIDALKSANPKNIYVMLGSNGMGWIDDSKMIADYSQFIDDVQSSLPSASIYIMSIPPVTAERELKPTVEEGKILNSDINDYNAQLLDLANQKGVHYIDVNSALVDSNGKLPSDVSTDGMHFDKNTYVKVVEYILTHVAE